MPDEITRPEYEADRRELLAELHSLSIKLDGLSVETQKNRFETQQQISSMKIDFLKYIVTSCVSMVIGGGTYALGEFFITHHF